jgi:hypothetical protein
MKVPDQLKPKDMAGGIPDGSGIPKEVAQTLRPVKVTFRAKAAAFVMTVITLSWFFEGYRQVSAALTLEHCAVLAAGTALTLILLAVQGYWIYVEEKTKGTLKRRIGMYERFYANSSWSRRSGSGEES